MKFGWFYAGKDFWIKSMGKAFFGDRDGLMMISVIFLGVF